MNPNLCNSTSIKFHILYDSVSDNLVENLEQTINMQRMTNGVHQIVPQESSERIFIQDPPWIRSLLLKGLYQRSGGMKLKTREIERRKYNLLRRRQIKEETESWDQMVQEYKELEREMCEKKLAPHLPYVKSLFLAWFEPLREAIVREQNLQRTKKRKAAYAPHVDLLPADKMALIVMHKMMALLMMGHDDGCVRVVQAAVQIGVAIEQEVISQFFWFLHPFRICRVQY